MSRHVPWISIGAVRCATAPVTLPCDIKRASRRTLCTRSMLVSFFFICHIISLIVFAGIGSANAYEIRIDVAHCASNVHLFAHDAPLSEILRRLSINLGFEVRYESAIDPSVNTDSTMRVPDLVTSIGRSMNLSIVEYPNSNCHNLWQVTKVMVLPTSGERQLTLSPVLPPNAFLATPDQIRQSEEEGEKFLYETHGGPPPRSLKRN